MNLEYSYRPMKEIKNYWAGPSFWKFNRSGKGPAAAAGSGGPSEPKKRKVTTRRVWQPITMTPSPNQPQLISVKSRAAKRLYKRDITKNWSEDKLRLPPVMAPVPSDYFDRYRFAPGLVKRQYNVSAAATAVSGESALVPVVR